MVTRPGKPCSSSSVTEGPILGQHAAAYNSRGFSKPPPTMVSEVVVTSGGERRKLTATWHKPNRGQDYTSPYSVNAKKPTHTIYHNAGRITEATVTEHPNHFRGRASAGSFMRFPPTRATTK
jgi:hypothetical protein